jgi:hypothetical protein
VDIPVDGVPSEECGSPHADIYLSRSAEIRDEGPMLSRLQADADRQFLFPRPAVFEPAFRSVLLTYILFLINVPPLQKSIGRVDPHGETRQ